MKIMKIFSYKSGINQYKVSRKFNTVLIQLLSHKSTYYKVWERRLSVTVNDDMYAVLKRSNQEPMPFIEISALRAQSNESYKNFLF